MLFWWPIVHSAPRLRPRPAAGACVIYLVLAAIQTGFSGCCSRPRHVGVGGAVDMLAVLILVGRSLASQDRAGARDLATH